MHTYIHTYIYAQLQLATFLQLDIVTNALRHYREVEKGRIGCSYSITVKFRSRVLSSEMREERDFSTGLTELF